MGLEEARENLNTSYESAASETSTNDQHSNSDGRENDQGVENSQIKELMDLESLEKFKYKGQELTPKELEKRIMMQQDYTRKTQAIAEERKQIAEEKKYAEALQYDIAAVLQNPNLIYDFKKVYPKQYHGIVDQFLANQPVDQNSARPRVDPQLLQVRQEIDEIREYQLQRDTEVHLAKIDAIFDKFSQKYDMADQETVLAKAEKIAESKKELSEQDWENLFKSEHEKHVGRYKSYYDKQFKNQQAASKKAKDISPGGGVPGSAPQTPKTLKEARAWAESELSGRNQ